MSTTMGFSHIMGLSMHQLWSNQITSTQKISRIPAKMSGPEWIAHLESKEDVINSFKNSLLQQVNLPENDFGAGGCDWINYP